MSRMLAVLATRGGDGEGRGGGVESIDLSMINLSMNHHVGGAGGGGERVTRTYTVEVQTASVFYAQSLILLLFKP